MLILGFESSCDETGVALYDTQHGLLAHALHSQVAMHAEFGGVVPELASRDHIRRALPLTEVVLKQANKSLTDIDGIAYTQGPGLAGALLVGTSIAQSLAFALNVPSVGVHHLEGHLLAPLLEQNPPKFPFVALLVSGGHSQLMRVDGIGQYQLLGDTLDDAAGEAFDKSGKILGLPYPAGPMMDKLARDGDPVYTFPIPQVEGLNFSFSGLKTSILYFVRDQVKKDPDFIKNHLNDICASIQHTIVEILTRKILIAANQLDITKIGIAGGVAANSGLREKLTIMGNENGWNLYFPAMQYCTDNAGMIAIAAHYQFLEKQFSPLDTAPFVRVSCLLF